MSGYVPGHGRPVRSIAGHVSRSTQHAVHVGFSHGRRDRLRRCKLRCGAAPSKRRTGRCVRRGHDLVRGRPQRQTGRGRAQLGGRRMHINCIGDGGAIVVVDAGAGNFSAHWVHLHKRLAAGSRVCLYDRAGLGCDPSGAPATAERAARDLARLLETTGEAGPFVLVGHSYGGYVARVFHELGARRGSAPSAPRAAFTGGANGGRPRIRDPGRCRATEDDRSFVLTNNAAQLQNRLSTPEPEVTHEDRADHRRKSCCARRPRGCLGRAPSCRAHGDARGTARCTA